MDVFFSRLDCLDAGFVLPDMIRIHPVGGADPGLYRDQGHSGGSAPQAKADNRVQK